MFGSYERHATYTQVAADFVGNEWTAHTFATRAIGVTDVRLVFGAADQSSDNCVSFDSIRVDGRTPTAPLEEKSADAVQYPTLIYSYDECLTFIGSNNTVHASNSMTLGSSWSIEFWMKPTTPNYGDPVGCSNSSDADRGVTFVTYSDGHMLFAAGNCTNSWGTGVNPGAGALSNGNWYHVVGTNTEGVLRLYLNGEQAGSTGSASGSWTDYTLNIGDRRRGGMYPFKGSVANVKVYDTPLTAEEVNSKFQEQKDHF